LKRIARSGACAGCAHLRGNFVSLAMFCNHFLTARTRRDRCAQIENNIHLYNADCLLNLRSKSTAGGGGDFPPYSFKLIFVSETRFNPEHYQPKRKPQLTSTPAP
jgi:hypothetical protein